MKKYAPFLMMLSLVVASIACAATGDEGSIDEQLQIGITIEGRVWDDLNANGIQDPGERGLADVPVFLWDVDQNAVIESTRTNAQGMYTFRNLRSNEAGYMLEFERLPGYLFTEQNAGSDRGLDSDADEETGLTKTFEVDIDIFDLDAGMIQGFLPPQTPTPEESSPPTPTEPVSSGTDEPTALITTNSGCEIAYYGSTEASRSGSFTVMFDVDCGGNPGSGNFFATLGDPPSSAEATHASGELDANGEVTLMLDVNWSANTTILLCSYEGAVYEVIDITVMD